VRRPEAMIRCLLGLLLLAALLLLAGAGQHRAAPGVSAAPLEAVRLLALAALLLLPAAYTVRGLLLGRDGRRLVDGALAAACAYGAALAVDLWLAPPAAARQAVAQSVAQSVPQAVVLTAPVLAFMTAAGVARAVRWPSWLAAVLLFDLLVALVGPHTGTLALLVPPLIGWTVAHAATYALGSPNERPTLERLLSALRQLAFTPVTAFHTEDTQPRRYLVHQADGGAPLDVVLLDREQSASGFRHQVWRRLRLRTAPRRSRPLSLHATLQREALLSFAAQAAGVRTRQLLATAELGPDAALAVYRPLAGRTLDQLLDSELTDSLLADAYRQLQLLSIRQIAHRNLAPTALLLDDEHGAVHLVDLRDGDIAAGDLALRMDLAQLLTTLSRRVGPARAVAAAFAVLGPEQVGAAVPLLQPLALSRANRPSRAEPDLLGGIREEILRTSPQAPVELVRLERLRARTLVTLLGSAVAGYSLMLELSARDSNPIGAMARAQSGWMALAAAAALAGFVAATMSFVGFVPERLNLRRAGLVQVAASFVNLVTPSGVGGMAINTRFLHRSGVPPRQAVASVGVGQAVGLVLHILLVLVFGYLASTRSTSSLSVAPALLTGLLAAAVLLLLAAAVGPVRRWLVAKLQPLLSGVLPRMLDLLQQPGRVAVGVVGQLFISLTSAGSLYFCARAFGQHPGFAAVAVANLVGGAIGSAIPTPGGIGGVETALPLALEQAAGMAASTAIPAVLLFRLLTFWLPVLPGWVAFVWLQRRRVI
jgi:uncharacterized protein (TIRG00374 family)